MSPYPPQPVYAEMVMLLAAMEQDDEEVKRHVTEMTAVECRHFNEAAQVIIREMEMQRKL